MTGRTLRDAAVVYAVCVGLTGLATILLFATSPAAARRLMPLGFGCVPAGVGAAVSIAVANGRVALVPLALAPIVHQGRAVRLLGDSLLTGIVLVNAAEVGAALAGYGSRAALALAPHAAVELAAYALAGAAYLAGRRAPLGPRRLVVLAAGCAALLAVAALLETYVQLRAPA